MKYSGRNPDGTFKKGVSLKCSQKTQFKNGSNSVDGRVLKGKNAPIWIDGYSDERYNASLKNKGFIPLNHKTTMSNTQHHLDNNTLVFEPKSLHNACNHSGNRSNSDYRIIANMIALAWLNVQPQIDPEYRIMDSI